VLETCDPGNIAQRWVSSNGQITYKAYPSKCVDSFAAPFDGSRIQIWDCNGAPQQGWGFDATQLTIYLAWVSDRERTPMPGEEPVPSTTPLSGSHSSPLSEGATRCLDTPTPYQVGETVQSWQCNGWINQQWTLNPSSQIYSNAAAACLTVQGGLTSNGHLLVLEACDPSNVAQRWIFSNGQIIYKADPSKCVDAVAAPFDGSRVQIWDCNSSPQQGWGFDAAQLTIYLTSVQQPMAPSLEATSRSKEVRPFAAGRHLKSIDIMLV